MKSFVWITLFLVASSATASAQERPRRSKWWTISSIVLAAAVAADAHSSWGRLEANPVLAGQNGRFGARGVALKSLFAGGTIGAQYFLLKKRPSAEKFAVISNFAIAGMLSGVAVRNHHQEAGILRPKN